MKELPPFEKRSRDAAAAFVTPLLVNEQRAGESQLIDVVEYGDGHFRALFKPGYFVLQEGQTEPTKSQWNSLKKKLKRHDPAVFVFKEHGQVEAKEPQYYLDFGFLPELPPTDIRHRSARR